MLIDLVQLCMFVWCCNADSGAIYFTIMGPAAPTAIDRSNESEMLIKTVPIGKFLLSPPHTVCKHRSTGHLHMGNCSTVAHHLVDDHAWTKKENLPCHKSYYIKTTTDRLDTGAAKCISTKSIIHCIQVSSKYANESIL